jgi:hypothetical protein
MELSPLHPSSSTAFPRDQKQDLITIKQNKLPFCINRHLLQVLTCRCTRSFDEMCLFGDKQIIKTIIAGNWNTKFHPLVCPWKLHLHWVDPNQGLGVWEGWECKHIYGFKFHIELIDVQQLEQSKYILCTNHVLPNPHKSWHEYMGWL